MREDGQVTAATMPPDAVRWLRRFAWVAVLGPVVFVVALPYLAMLVMEPRFPRRGMLLSAIIGATVVVAFGLVMVTLVAHAYRGIVALQERALSAERHSAVLVERGRIAREMHDSLAQALAVTHLRLRVLETDPSVASAPEVRDEVHELADLCQESVRDVRETILGLRCDARSDACLADSLAELLGAFGRSTGIETGLAADPPGLDLPPEQRVQASRVVQEALANARKHSGASHVQVTLARTDGRTRLVVSDDGCGFDTAAAPPEGHYGLATMSERIAQVGGRLDVVSAPGQGTSIVVDLPDQPSTSPSRQEKR